jgi:hypothetical protein
MNKRRVEELTTEELDAFARESWGAAAKEALARGLPITGSRDGRRVRYHPDGRIEGFGSLYVVVA